jgi:hypothetical protein
VSELIGYCVSIGRVCVVVEEIFARAEEPVESDDGEVDEMRPAHAKFWVVPVENVDQGLDDGDVVRVCVVERAA